MKTVINYLCLRSILCLLTFIGFVNATAQEFIKYDFTVDGYYYRIISEEEKKVAITYEEYDLDKYYDEIVYSNYTGSVSIPSSVTYNSEDYKVTSIDAHAFDGSSITSVNIPNSIVEIGDYAFFDCRSLQSITIPQSVKTIGIGAFNGCIALSSIQLSYGITTINNSTFSDCKSLSSIIIPSSVTSIGSYVFSGCSSLSTVVLSDYLNTIGSSAFYGCSNLTSICIPKRVYNYDSSAFNGCNSLTSVTVESLTPVSISSNTFPNRTNATLYVPYGSKEAYETAGYWKEFKEIVEKYVSGDTFTAMTIEGVEVTYTIVNEAQKTCKVGYTYVKKQGIRYAIDQSITGIITIPRVVNGYTVIGVEDYAFSRREKLTSVILPSSIRYIGTSAFSDCSGLESMSIPESVTSIGGNAFSGCTNLRTINIPSGVTVIKESTFWGCKSLIAIELPDNLTEIGNYAFYHCSGLTEITIPGSLRKMETWDNSFAFIGCSGLRKITINKGVALLGNSTFGSSPVETVVVYNTNPISVRESFDDFDSHATLYVPSGCIEAYKAATGWNNFKNYVEMDPDVDYSNIGKTFTDNGINYKVSNINPLEVQVGWYTGYSAGAIDEKYEGPLTIPSSVTGPDGKVYSCTSIMSSAFSYCGGLTSVTIPNSVIEIGSSAFSGCSGLTSVTIPNSLTEIGSSAFSGCSGLTSVHITDLEAWCKMSFGNNNPLSYAHHLFMNGKEIKDLVIPNSVTSIGSYAFEGCSGLTSVTIPNSVTEIGSSAFYDCSGLKNITMPNTIISIGNGAFHQTDWYINQPEGVVYAGKIAYTYKGTMSSSTNISIQEGTLAIAPGAFGNCTGMTSASIPNSVELIGSRAFYNCSNLMIVNIGNSVNSIEDKAFKDCNKLTSVTLGKETPLVINSETFSNSKNAKLYIPYGSKTAYEAADYWKEFKEIIEIKPSSPSSTLISFTDAIVKEICLDNWDVDSDRELSIEEAAAVSDLGTTFQNKNNIVSFDELEYFTGLTSISNYAFSNCTNLKNISLPNTILSIGEGAFSGCNNLAEFKMPNTITSIEKNAFSNCCSLSSITIPAALASISDYMFYNCSSLIGITIPNSVTSIGEGAFSQCSSLIDITIPNSVTEIKTNTFYGCTNMTNVTIPNSVTKIGWLAFRNCSNIESITIPNSVTTIVLQAFENCTSLKDVNIPNSVTYIGEKVFSNTGIFNNSPDGVFYVDKWVCGYKGNMPSETSLILEEGTRGISIGAFRNNSNLSSITIPGSVTCINDDAFYGCNNLTSVTVEMVEPISITSYYTFSNAYNATLYVPAGAKSAYLSADGWKDFKKIIEPPIQFADPNVKDICISKWDSNKDGELDQYEASLVTDLGRAFTENETITSFEELKYFTGITSLDGKFYKCSALKSVIIPVGVTSIGASEFSGCSLEYLDIVQNNATFYSPNKSNAIINKSTHELVKGCKSTIIPDDVTAIGEYAFYGSNGLGDFTIPETITSIGDMAFALCNGLTSINIPSSVTNMGTWVFTRSKDLVSVTISDGITKISNGAFDGCSSLSFISIPKSITTIGSDTFEDCSSLTSITIPSSVETMMYAFYGCNNLTSVTVERETPVTISEKDFPNRKNATLYVPKGAKTAYERVAYWKEFGCILEQGTVLTENNSIYAEDVSVYIGYTADLQINMSNEDTFTAYQFDLVLPNGITLAKDEKGKYIVTLSNRHSDNTHQVTIDDIGDNTFRFVCVSLNTSVINGNDGTILTVSLKADGDIAEGELNATIKNVILTTADETKMKPKNSSFTIKTMVLLKGDADGDGEIDVTDVVSTINYIIGNPSAKFNFLAADLNEDGEVDIFDVMMAINLVFSQKNSSRSLTRATSGSEEQAIVKVADDRIIFGVNDASRFTAFQFDVELTNAVELKDVRLNADAHHDLQFVRIGQDTYRVIGISMDNSTLTTNGNDFVELRLSKEWDAQICNIVFVTPNETKVHFAGCYVNLTEIRNTTLDQSEEIFDLSGRKIDAERNRLPKGVYIINNKKVVIK